MISVSCFIVGWLVCKPLSRWVIAVLPPYNVFHKLTGNGLLSLSCLLCTLSSLYINNQSKQKSNCYRNNHYLPVVGPNVQKKENFDLNLDGYLEMRRKIFSTYFSACSVNPPLFHPTVQVLIQSSLAQFHCYSQWIYRYTDNRKHRHPNHIIIDKASMKWIYITPDDLTCA